MGQAKAISLTATPTPALAATHPFTNSLRLLFGGVINVRVRQWASMISGRV